MNKQVMQVPLTILVAGNSEQHALSPKDIKAFKAVLTDVGCLVKNTPVRILTGTASFIEQTAIEIAEEQHWPLHILMPGLLEADDALEKKAERLVGLGIGEDKSQPFIANKIRDEIALAFADVVVVVGDETQFQADQSLLHLLFSAAISRKSVLWLDLQGKASVLDVTQIDEGVVLLLNGHQPTFNLVKSCFVAFSANKHILQTQLYPDLKSINDYYACTDTPSSTVVSLADKCYWGPVKPKDKGIFRWPDNNHFNSVSQFERFDVASTITAKHHRRGIWYLYLCTPLAVLSAIAGAIHLFEIKLKFLWGPLEFILLSFIVVFLLVQKTLDWHGRWIAERFMAEQLRYLRMGLPLFAIPKIFTESVWAVVEDENGSNAIVLRSAELWFLQKILHVEGLPQMEHKKGYSLAEAPDFIDYVEAVVKDQIKYHSDKKSRAHKTHQCLHFLSLLFFVITMLTVVAHLCIHSELLLFVTIGLPAVAAALYGIGTKLELTRIANQSELTRRNLEHVKGVFPKLRQQKEQNPEMSRWEYWLHLRHLTMTASRIMSEENVQWQALIEGQEPELPG